MRYRMKTLRASRWWRDGRAQCMPRGPGGQPGRAPRAPVGKNSAPRGAERTLILDLLQFPQPHVGASGLRSAHVELELAAGRSARAVAEHEAVAERRRERQLVAVAAGA